MPAPTASTLYDEAVSLKVQGDLPGAIAKLDEALTLSPDDALCHGMLAKLHVDRAEKDKAVFHAKRVVELEPDDVFSYTALSVIYQRCGMIREAEDAKAVAHRKEHGIDD